MKVALKTLNYKYNTKNVKLQCKPIFTDFSFFFCYIVQLNTSKYLQFGFELVKVRFNTFKGSKCCLMLSY